LQTSDATGAAQSQLGADAQAAVVDLNKRAGMSHGKIADTFHRLFGIRLSRGASAQIVLRCGQRLKPVYQQIREQIKVSNHLTPDETGWRHLAVLGGTLHCTSAAAPQAAALAALVWARHPGWTAKQVSQELRRASLDLGPMGHDWQTGHGLLRLPAMR